MDEMRFGASANKEGCSVNTTKKRPESVMIARDPEVLQTMLDFYAAPGSRVLDCTSNKRRIWKGVIWQPGPVFMDIDPTMSPDIVGDYTSIPVPDNSYDVLIFDPPHLPSVAVSESGSTQMAESYGLSMGGADGHLESSFSPFLKEAKRVLRPDGLIFAKLKDFVHNHRYHWMLAAWVAAVKSVNGITPCDLIVKRDPCGGNLKSSKWINSHHVRNCHCWWTVSRKGKCESTKT